jgi:hypothetical protein
VGVTIIPYGYVYLSLTSLSRLSNTFFRIDMGHRHRDVPARAQGPLLADLLGRVRRRAGRQRRAGYDYQGLGRRERVSVFFGLLLLYFWVLLPSSSLLDYICIKFFYLFLFSSCCFFFFFFFFLLF